MTGYLACQQFTGDRRQAIERLADGLGLQKAVAWFNNTHDCRNYAHVIEGAALVVIWNAELYSNKLIREFARRNNVPVIVMEAGFCGVAESYTWDRDSLPRSVLHQANRWVTAQDRGELSHIREQYRERHPPLVDGYSCLIPFHVGYDASTMYSSGCGSLEKQLACFDRLVGCEEPVTVRGHPHDDQASRAWLRGEAENRGWRYQVPEAMPFMEAVARSGRVLGLVSSALMEAAVYGVNVAAIGEHPLNPATGLDSDTVAAGALALRTLRSEDPTPVVRRLLEMRRI